MANGSKGPLRKRGGHSIANTNQLIDLADFMRCDQCRHWTKDTDGNYPEYLGLGKCSRVKLYWECTEWDSESEDRPRKFTDAAKDNLAFVQDGSDYRAELITLGGFGCVQFALSCTCQSECECEDPARGLMSNECPEHNLYPHPAPDCPIHAT